MTTPLKGPPREEIDDDTIRASPNFEIGYGTVSWNDEQQGIVQIQTLDIQCATTDAQLLKEMFSSIDFTEYFNAMLFIPRGLTKLHNNPMAYKKYVNLHMQYMQNTTQFAITGMTKQAFEYKIETDNETYTPKQILFNSKYIEAIHTTVSTNTRGIWLIVTTKQHLVLATEFFDSKINKIYEYIPNAAEYIDHRNIVPSRIAQQRQTQSTKTLERSNILNKLIPQIIIIPDLHKKPFNKRNITYDNISTKTKLQKIQDSATPREKSSTTDTTVNTQYSTETEKMTESLRQMENKLQEVTNQVLINEQRRVQQQLDNTKDNTQIITNTLQKELPTYLQNTQNSMIHQITELNDKFDLLMNKLLPIHQNNTSDIAMEHNAQIMLEHQEPLAIQQSNSTTNITNNAVQTTTAPITTQHKTSPTYATPVNQWNIVGTRRKIPKDFPFSKEKAIKETTIKEKLILEDRARHAKKVIKRTNEPMLPNEPARLL